jgi:hypothetical protein
VAERQRDFSAESMKQLTTPTLSTTAQEAGHYFSETGE